MQGHVTSFFSSSLDKYTSFQAHHEDIRQILSVSEGVVTISENELRLTSRTGLPLYTKKDDHALCKMNCALNLDDSSLLVGCHANKITTVDLNQGQIVQEVQKNVYIQSVVKVKEEGWSWAREGECLN